MAKNICKLLFIIIVVLLSLVTLINDLIPEFSVFLILMLIMIMPALLICLLYNYRKYKKYLPVILISLGILTAILIFFSISKSYVTGSGNQYTYIEYDFATDTFFTSLYFICITTLLFINVYDFINDIKCRSDILLLIILGSNILIHLNYFLNHRIQDIPDYLDKNYLNQNYGLYACMFFCIIIYKIINHNKKTMLNS